MFLETIKKLNLKYCSRLMDRMKGCLGGCGCENCLGLARKQCTAHHYSGLLYDPDEKTVSNPPPLRNKREIHVDPIQRESA